MLTVNQNNNMSFGQVNLIRVSKKAFKYPDNMKDCELEFKKQLNKLNGDKFGNATLGMVIKRILDVLFPTSHKYYIHMEGKRDIKLVNSPADKDYHSFGVYTGEDGQKMFQLFSKKHTKENARITDKEYTFEDYMSQFSNVVRYMTPSDKALCMQKYAKEQVKCRLELLSRQIKEAFAGKKIYEFRINKLEELKELKSKLGLNH